MTRDGRPGPDPLESTLAETGPTPPPSQRPAPGGATAPAELPVVSPETYDAGAEVARGGMGRIYAARDRRLARTVAIKELVGDSAGLRRRFEREALITARLQHPAIVPIYEAGRWPSGEPFYAMKLVAGRSLKDVLAGARNAGERLALLGHVITVVDALAYAHGEGIVHRDLKPANVLVGSFGETVVIDWGLAKDITAGDDVDEDDAPGAAGPSSSAEELTQAGSVMGTPAYMPPEQAQGAPVDRRADVYALGAILYHVLSGKPPYSERSSVVELLAASTSGPPRPLAELAPGLPPDLVAIVEKAMARAPEARYPSARELALELHRFQTGQLVATHHYTTWQLVRRFVRRQRAPLLVATVMLATIVVVVAISFRRVVRERDRATAARVALEAKNDSLTLDQARASVERDPGGALALLRGLRPDATVWPAARVVAADAWARGAPRVLRAERLVGRFALAQDASWIAAADNTGSLYLFGAQGGEPRRLVGKSPLFALEASPDGRTVATAELGGRVVLWDVATGAPRELGQHEGAAIGLVWTPDGKSVVTSGLDGRVVVREVATGAAHELTRHSSWSIALQLSKDGRFLAESALQQPVRVWDLPSGRLVAELGRPSLAMTPMAISADGRLVATATADRVDLWEPASHAHRVLKGRSAEDVAAIVFSPDGRWLAVSGPRRGLEVWELASGERLALGGTNTHVNDAAFSPDGQWLAAGTASGVVQLHDLAHGSTRSITGHAQGVMQVGFSADGRSLVSGSADGTVRQWRLEDQGTRRLADALHGPQQVALSADGRIAAIASMGDPIWLWDTASGAGRALAGGEPWLADLALAPDGARLATVSVDRHLRLWDLGAHASRRLDCDAEKGVRFAADGAHVAVAAGDGPGVCLVDLGPGGRARRLATPSWTRLVAFSPDGRRLASGDDQGNLVAWSSDGTELGRWLAPVADAKDGPASVLDLALSPAGDQVASVSSDGQLRLWRVGTSEARTLTTQGAPFEGLVWAGDGASFATVDNTNTVRRWDAASGQELGAPRHFGDGQRGARWSAGGRWLVAASAESELESWDSATGERRELRGAPRGLMAAAISADGRIVVAAGSDGQVRVWEDPLPGDPGALSAWLREHVPAAAPVPAPPTR